MEERGKLYTMVMAKLEFQPNLDASNITIAIKGQSDIVVLGGTVKSYAEKLIAEDAVRNIIGVKAVVDETKVDASVYYKRSDTDIATTAMNSLKWNVMIPEDKIKLVVEDGVITLSGSVEWGYQKYSAGQAVSGLWGVKSVINNILVSPIIKIDANKVKEQIRQEFERNARLDASKIKVEISGSKIILRGTLRNLEEEDEAVDVAWSVPGVTSVKDEIEIA